MAFMKEQYGFFYAEALPAILEGGFKGPLKSDGLSVSFLGCLVRIVST